MNIPFLDLKAINQPRHADFHAALERVLDSGWLILGRETEAFEQEFAAYCETSQCAGIANGLDALHLVLRAWGIGPGDEVIVPSNTFFATWLAVSHAGAIPVAVEPDPATYNLDPARIEAAITGLRVERPGSTPLLVRADAGCVSLRDSDFGPPPL